MTRWKAAGIHLAISAAIGLVALAVLRFVWYPPPYFMAAGGGRLAMILLGVDVVVGPLLTLLVYRAGKRGLRFDLTIIALLQFGALVYGMHVMWVSRPVYLVSAVDRFILVHANQISDAALAEAAPGYGNLPCCGPRLVGASLPKDPKEREDLLFSSSAGGADIDTLPRYYHPYEESARALAERGTALEDFMASRPRARDAIAGALGDRHASGVVAVPVMTRERDVTMLLDAATGQPLKAVDVDPW